MTANFWCCSCSRPLRPASRHWNIAPPLRQSLKHKEAFSRCRHAAVAQRVLASSQQAPESSQAGKSSQQQNKQARTERECPQECKMKIWTASQRLQTLQEVSLLTTQRSQPPALPPQKNDDNLLAVRHPIVAIAGSLTITQGQQITAVVACSPSFVDTVWRAHLPCLDQFHQCRVSLRRSI